MGECAEAEWIMLRHGLTRANAERRYIGRTDEPLSEEGRRMLAEAAQAGVYAALGKAEVVLESPMRRCVETRKLLLPERSAAQIPEWREINFGVFEGKNYAELKSLPEYNRWLDSMGSLPFPAGEGREAFGIRCMRGLERAFVLLAEYSPERKPPLVVAVVHGGTIMAVLSALTGENFFSYPCANGEGYRFHLRRADGAYEIANVDSFPWARRERTNARA